MKIKIQPVISPMESPEFLEDGSFEIEQVFTNEKHPKTIFYLKVKGELSERNYFATVSPSTGKVQLQELKKIAAGFDKPEGEDKEPAPEEEESEDAK